MKLKRTVGQVDDKALILQICVMPLKFKLSNDPRRKNFDFNFRESSSDAHATSEAKRQISEWMRVFCMRALGVFVVLQPSFRNKFPASFELIFIKSKETAR